MPYIGSKKTKRKVKRIRKIGKRRRERNCIAAYARSVGFF